jgi:UDP-N-acetylglucosamine 3-dehydrogenase
MNAICLVGCGAIARVHVKNLAGKAELSFCSRTRASAEALRRECGGGRVFDSYDQVLASDVDAVLISSPPEAHREQVVAALAAGKGVLVEKPLCATEADLEAIGAALCDDSLLMVAENYYYKPSLQVIKWIIGQGFIGEVQRVETGKRFAQAAAGWKSGYGALLEGGIHFVALGADLFGHETIRRVMAEFPGHVAGQPERNSVVRVVYAGGAELVLRYAWNAFSPTKGIFQHSRVEGTAGRVVFESNGIYVRLKGRRKRLYFPGVRDLMGYGAMTRDFLQCLQVPGKKPYSDFSRAERDLGIVFAAYKGLEGRQ